MNSTKIIKKVMLIGAGNVAHQISKRLIESGYTISMVVSRNIIHAQELTQIVGGIALNKIPQNIDSVDLIIISINDNQYHDTIQQINTNSSILVLHTSGSIGIDVFKNKDFDYGVLYPFQTFSKHRKVDFQNIPIFIEAKNEEVLFKIEKFASSLSNHIHLANSSQREVIHLAGVFACNFVNHLFVEASDILAKQNIDFSVLNPLITETVSKAMEISPLEAQTGPALRNDQNIIQKHINLLQNDKQRNLYRLISDLISEKHLINDKL